MKIRDASLSAIDLFAGAGGLSLGLKMSGLNVVAALDSSLEAIETHASNFPETLHIVDDARRVAFKSFKKIDVVAGGPPCQPFSVSGKQLGEQDSRDLVPLFILALRDMKPSAFIMENVAGLATERFKPYLFRQIDEMRRLGYKVNMTVLDAADYGVPQRRERLFVVGTREGVQFEFPEPTHGTGRPKPYMTVRHALNNCPTDEPNTAKVVYAKNPIVRKQWNAGMLLNGKGRPLDLDQPSFTIPATAGGNRTHIIDTNDTLRQYHAHLLAGGSPRKGVVTGARRLTVRESARIQTFPDWFVFTGARSKRYSQIGNAVPPVLAAAVAAALVKALTVS
jgi:DNA (cytosine-5)-methyltransferase 1